MQDQGYQAPLPLDFQLDGIAHQAAVQGFPRVGIAGDYFPVYFPYDVHDHDAGQVRRAVRVDFIHQHAQAVDNAQFLRHVLRDVDHRKPRPSTSRSAILYQFVRNAPNPFDGYGETHALRAAAFGEDERVDADDLAEGVDQGTSAVARIDGRVGLDHVPVDRPGSLLPAEVSSKGADHPDSHGRLGVLDGQAQRIADGNGPLAGHDVVRPAQRRHGEVFAFHVEHGQIRHDVHADQGAGQAASVGQDGLDSPCCVVSQLHHVGIGDDVTRVVDNYARSRVRLLAGIKPRHHEMAEEGVVGHGGESAPLHLENRNDAHDCGTRPLHRGHDGRAPRRADRFVDFDQTCRQSAGSHTAIHVFTHPGRSGSATAPSRPSRLGRFRVFRRGHQGPGSIPGLRSPAERAQRFGIGHDQENDAHKRAYEGRQDVPHGHRGSPDLRVARMAFFLVPHRSAPGIRTATLQNLNNADFSSEMPGKVLRLNDPETPCPNGSPAPKTDTSLYARRGFQSIPFSGDRSAAAPMVRGNLAGRSRLAFLQEPLNQNL